jgi:hypothetical protein
VEEPAWKPDLVPAPTVCQMGLGVRAESDPLAPSARFAMERLRRPADPHALTTGQRSLRREHARRRGSGARRGGRIRTAGLLLPNLNRRGGVCQRACTKRPGHLDDSSPSSTGELRWISSVSLPSCYLDERSTSSASRMMGSRRRPARTSEMPAQGPILLAVRIRSGPSSANESVTSVVTRGGGLTFWASGWACVAVSRSRPRISAWAFGSARADHGISQRRYCPRNHSSQ